MSLPPIQQIEAKDPNVLRIRRQIANSFLFWSVLIIGSLFLGGGFGLIAAPLAIGWLILQNAVALYHHNQIENFQHYRQIESLMSLHALIDIRYPLPPMRLWVISPDFAALLAATIREHQPKTIVELGSGTSTVIGGYALETTPGGHIYSLEHLKEFVTSSQHTLSRHGLADSATIIHAPLTPYPIASEADASTQRQWYDTTTFGHIMDIDLLVVDGPPENTHPQARYPALRFFYDRLSDGAIILVDDAMRNDDHNMINRWIDEFNLTVVDQIANEKGAVVLQKTGKARPTLADADTDIISEGTTDPEDD